MVLATPPAEAQARRCSFTRWAGRGYGHGLAQGPGLLWGPRRDGGARQGVGRGEYGAQRRGWIAEACPRSGSGSRCEAGAQFLLGSADAAGKTASIPGQLLPRALAGSLGWPCPDNQEMDGDLVREVHLETDGQMREPGMVGRRENQIQISHRNTPTVCVTCLPPRASPLTH